MKKFIFSLFSLFAVSATAFAQSITVSDIEVLPGETVKATLKISDPTQTFTGIQFALQFPATGFSVASGAATGWPGLIETGTMTNGKVKISASATNPFESADVDVEFTVEDATELGEKTVTVTDIKFEKSGTVQPIDDVPFKVTVTDRITLDENSTTLPKARTGVNVKVKRTIKAGEWSTLCVPFVMSKAQATAAFGDDVEIKAYDSYTAVIDENTLIPSAITLNFKAYTLSALKKIQTGTPYLIKTSQDIESFDVDNVTVSTTTSDVSGAETEYGLEGKYSGVLAKTKVPAKGLFISGNKFYYSTGETNIKAFRGWFNLQAIYNEAIPTDAPVYLSFDNANMTGVSSVKINQADGAFYNLNGQRIANPQKGLFIKGGKKVVIK